MECIKKIYFTRLNQSNNFFLNYYTAPLLIGVGWFLGLILPSLHQNLSDPNLINYFHFDEGYLMDLGWLMYSGEHRLSFHSDFPYGVLLLYCSAFCRYILSYFIEITPITFVLILRYLNLLAWLFIVVALWRFMHNHFRQWWKYLIILLFLASRPEINSLVATSKPDPIVLLVMLLGLNYTLKMIDQPSWLSFIFAVICASLGTLVKFGGIFLLPPILVSMYLADTKFHFYSKYLILQKIKKISWTWPFMGSFGAIVIFLYGIRTYVRFSTGRSFYEDYGYLGTFQHLLGLKLIWVVGVLWILFVVIYYMFMNSKQFRRINFYIFIILGVFFLSTLLFGSVWFFRPEYFIKTYALFPLILMSTEGNHGAASFWEWGRMPLEKSNQFNFFILILVVAYIFLEYYLWKLNIKTKENDFFKRIVLLIFLIPFFVLFCLPGQFRIHSMLPFILVSGILSIEGLGLFYEKIRIQKELKYFCLIFVLILFNVALYKNFSSLIQGSIKRFHRTLEEDAASDVRQWLVYNVDFNARILSDNFGCVYVPSDYLHVQTFNAMRKDSLGISNEKINHIIKTFHPGYLYVNHACELGILSVFSKEKLTSAKNIELLASFDGKNKVYKRYPNGKFSIYKFHY